MRQKRCQCNRLHKRRSALAGVRTVTVDSVAVGYQATKGLIELGHEKIMFLSGPPDSATSQQRREGCCHAMPAGKTLDSATDPYESYILIKKSCIIYKRKQLDADSCESYIFKAALTRLEYYGTKRCRFFFQNKQMGFCRSCDRRR